MKRSLLKPPMRWLFNLIFIFSYNAYSQCPTVVWSDEFNGTALDVSKWNYQTGDGCAEGICGWGNNELQSYQQENVVVSDGTLKITARKERKRGSAYTSGRINTKGKADFTYGRFEALIKLPYGDGLWPAFWMLSTDEPYGGWPQSGEIDIMEFVASKPDETLGYIHYGDPYPNNQNQGNTYKLAQGNFPDGYHEFALEWEPGEIRWFVDGILFSVKRTEDLEPYAWPFDHNFHFLLNVAVGGNLGGPVDDSMLPATMEVDYVRVLDGFKPYLDGNRKVAHQASGEVYTLGNLANNVNVTWTVPTGATIVNGQGSNSISVDFGSGSGDITATYDLGCGSQTLVMPVQVEPPYVYNYSFENFDAASDVTFNSATGTLTEVSNPAPNVVNSSTVSGKYDRDGSEQYDVLVYDVSSITDASQYVNEDRKFYMDVYTNAPVGTEILIQLETPVATPTNYPSGRHSRYSATTKTTGTWERLVFRLLDTPDASAGDTSVDQMVILFASNTFTADTYYFDNLDSYQAETGGTSNNPPSVSITNPTEGSTFETGTTIAIDADASDPDGTVTQVEFFVDGSSIGTDASSPYSISWQVGSGSQQITAEATDDAGAKTMSSAVTITGETTGSASSMSVSDIVTGTADAGKGWKYGTATVTILDNTGQPVSSAQVSGTFSGTFNESGSAQTDANGLAYFQTNATAKGGVTVNFCVDAVSHTSLTYDPNGNTITCTAGSAKSGSFAPSGITLYPNPTTESLYFPEGLIEKSTVVEIYDLSGKRVRRKIYSGATEAINVSDLARGMYLIKLHHPKKKMETKRFYKY